MNRIRNKIKTAFSLLKTPKQMILPAGQNGLLNFIPDELYLRMVFNAEMGYKLDLKHPKTYSEKLQWIKLNDRRKEYTLYADKYKVREYIANTLGEEYLIPLIGVYQKASDIPWDALPDRFVLKCNHASGTNIICTKKSELDVSQTVEMLDAWLKKNAFWGEREWCYKNIKPCIICEEFMDSGNGTTPDDYKIECFNGTPKLIQVHHDRFGEHTLDFMDENWVKTGIVKGPPNSGRDNPKPAVFDEMLEIARKLSKDMYYARVDLYVIREKIKFGEITMYPAAGFRRFDDPATDLMLGKWLHLPIDEE